MAKSTKSMSTSSSTSSSYSATSLRCYAHVPGTTEDIMPFKRTTWSTYLRCVGIWKDLVGNQADIARCFIRDHSGVSCGLERYLYPTMEVIIENATIISPIHQNRHEHLRRNRKQMLLRQQVGNGYHVIITYNYIIFIVLKCYQSKSG